MNGKRFPLLTLLLCLLGWPGPAVGAPAQQPLTLLVHPYQTAASLTKNFTPLAEYLSRAVNIPIRIKISESYKAHMHAVGEEQFDLAFLGPAPYVQITHTYGPKTILGRLEINGSPYFRGIIICRANDPITSLKELAGKKFAFGDPNSTMSHYVPRFMLDEAGVKITDLREHAFLGMHANVALGVIGGYYDAGGVMENTFDAYKDRGLRVLAKSPPIPEHLFVAAKHIPAETVAALRQALRSLRDPLILSPIKEKLTGIVPTDDKDYDFLRRILKKFDKLRVD